MKDEDLKKLEDELESYYPKASSDREARMGREASMDCMYFNNEHISRIHEIQNTLIQKRDIYNLNLERIQRMLDGIKKHTPTH
jgi:hypothetical protein